MSVAFTRHYPFLLESDVLSLSLGFAIRDGILYDIPLKAKHHLREPGEKIILSLIATSTYGNLSETARAHGATDKQCYELLGFLNMIGAIRCVRSPTQKIRALYAQGTHLLLGTLYAPHSWRRTPAPTIVALGILRAMRPVIVATTATVSLAIAGNIVSADLALSLGAFGLLLFISSLFVHEMTHIVIARHHSAQPQLIQSGLRLGIVHRKLQPAAEVLSSLAGPLTGSAICFLAAFLALNVGLNLPALLGIIVGLFHAFSLLPWYGDGASLSKALREKRGVR